MVVMMIMVSVFDDSLSLKLLCKLLCFVLPPLLGGSGTLCSLACLIWYVPACQPAETGPGVCYFCPQRFGGQLGGVGLVTWISCCKTWRPTWQCKLLNRERDLAFGCSISGSLH
jgi:hypothetical protein